jgi:hypothetical protein
VANVWAGWSDPAVDASNLQDGRVRMAGDKQAPMQPRLIPMSRRFAGKIAAAMFVMLTLPTCRRGSAEGTKPATSGEVGHDVNRLGRRIQLPVKPSEVWFEERPVGRPGGLGPTDYQLIAVMRFDPAALKTLEGATKSNTGQGAAVGREFDRPWLPPEVKAALQPRDEDSRRVRDGREFDGTPFFRSPFLTGYFVIVGATGYVLLSLQTT